MAKPFLPKFQFPRISPALAELGVLLGCLAVLCGSIAYGWFILKNASVPVSAPVSTPKPTVPALRLNKTYQRAGEAVEPAPAGSEKVNPFE